MQDKKALAVVPLSGCPVTNGHVHLVECALREADEVIVLLANSDSKSEYLFGLEEREAMMRRALAHLSNVTVMSSDGLLVDFVLEHGCDAIIRGTRNDRDMNYERDLIEMHASVWPPIRGYFLFAKTSPAFAHIEASKVRIRTKHHLHLGDLAPLFVQQAMEERVHGQYKLAVTGGIASGKTYVSGKLVERVREKGTSAHHINVDDLIRSLYDEPSRGAQKVREQLAKLCGAHVLNHDRSTVLRPQLKEALFGPSAPAGILGRAQEITMPHIERLYRSELKGKTGLIVLEWAGLVEMNMCHWANNNVLVVTAANHDTNAEERGISQDTLRKLAQVQLRPDQKVTRLWTQINLDKNGRVIEMLNMRNPTMFDQALDAVLVEVGEMFPALGL